MAVENEPKSPVFRWAQGLQWFGSVMCLLAIGLALFTEVTSAPGGVPLIVAFGILGLLSLIPARFIFALYPKSPDKKARKGQTRS